MKSLLVVVDMQRDFVSGPLGTKEAQNILPVVVRRIQEFQGDVVYTRDTHNGNYLQTQEGQQLPVVHCKGFGISFVFYLLQGFLGCTIQFKFYDVDVILRFSFIGM